MVMDKIEGIFISLGNSVNYRIGNHPLVNGKPDIFRMEWLDKSCALSDIKEIKEPTKVSLIVANM